MIDLIDFTNTEVVDGVPTGFDIPWTNAPVWFKDANGSLVKSGDGAGNSGGSRYLSIPGVEATDVDIKVASTVYRSNMANYPVGNYRTLICRSGGTLSSRTGIIVHIRQPTSGEGIGDRAVVQIHEAKGGSPVLIGQHTIYGMNAGHHTHTLRARVNLKGSEIKVKVWGDQNNEPDKWNAIQEVSLLTPGGFGFGAWGFQQEEFHWFSYDTDGVEAPNGPIHMPDFGKGEPDYTSLVNLAISCSYPLYGDGKSHDPRANIPAKDDLTVVLPAMRKARMAAIKKSHEVFDHMPVVGDINGGYAHCSRTAGTWIRLTTDGTMPGDWTEWQNAYFEDWTNGWRKVMSSSTYDITKAMPGDVWVTDGPGHVFIWIGEHGGHSDVIAEASWWGWNNPGSRVASLRRYAIDGIADNQNRHYGCWRYFGKPEKGLYLQTQNGLIEMESSMTI